MKTFLQFALPALMLLATPAFAQTKKGDKSKPASPSVQVTQKITGDATLTIQYGQPSVKGRTIGQDLEPMDGQIWRLGANDATTFTTDKALTIDGNTLPAGKYALFALRNGEVWTLIFNKVWKTWGAYDYEKNAGSDVLRTDVRQVITKTESEKLVFAIDADGNVRFNWGPYLIAFKATVAG